MNKDEFFTKMTQFCADNGMFMLKGNRFELYQCHIPLKDYTDLDEIYVSFTHETVETKTWEELIEEVYDELRDKVRWYQALSEDIQKRLDDMVG